MSYQTSRLHRFIGSATAGAFGLLSWCSLSTPAFACAVCFGDPNSSQTHGMNWAIVTMLGFVAAAFGAVGLLAYKLWRRARLVESVNLAADDRAANDAQPTVGHYPEALLS